MRCPDCSLDLADCDCPDRLPYYMWRRSGGGHVMDAQPAAPSRAGEPIGQMNKKEGESDEPNITHARG